MRQLLLVCMLLSFTLNLPMQIVVKEFVNLEKKDEEQLEHIVKSNYNLLFYDYLQNPYEVKIGVKRYQNLLLNTQTNIRQIYRINNELVGFYIAYKIRTFNNKHNKNFLPLDGVLVLMAVDKNQRGKGYGTDIMNKVVKWATFQGSPAIWVSVSKDNIPALQLYKKCGFSKTGMRRKDDASSIWLLKKLSNSLLYQQSFFSYTNHDLLFKYNN